MTVRVSKLVKRLGRFKLHIEELELDSGIHVIVGPNGSGKSTLLRILSGVMRPDSGSITYHIDGRRATPGEVLRYATLVTADMHLPDLRVIDLIRHYVPASGSRVRDIARFYGLEDMLYKYYGNLSSGFKKRVQISIALEKNTPILMLDEPFINVDSMFASVLEEKLLSMPEDRMVLVATHIPSMLLTQDIIYINDGRIIFKGRIEGLLENLIEVKYNSKEAGPKWCSLYELAREYSINIAGIRIKSIHEVIHKHTSTS